MYITCQDCKTTFRLDENLLKPTGSKVRCSQCGNIFVAVPPSKDDSDTIAQASPTTSMTAAPGTEMINQSQKYESAPPVATADDTDSGTPLSEGIDVAELDSLFKESQADAEVPSVETDIESDNLDDIDFDIDFDAALETDLADETDVAPAPSAKDQQPSDDWGDLDLELDFDLEADGEPALETPAVSNEQPSFPEVVPDESETTILGSEAADNANNEPDLENLELSLDLEDDSDATVFADISELNPSADADKDELLLDFDEDATVFAPTDDLSQGDVLSELDLDIEEDLDLDAILEDADQPKAEVEPDSVVEDLDIPFDDGLDLELELEDDDAAASEVEIDLPKLSDTFSEMEGDDLVLSDLDAILDEASLDSDEAEVKEDIELELDGDLLSQKGLREDDDEELEELSFELDAEYEDKPIAQTDTSSAPAESIEQDDEEEIDLSDIEQMLEGDGELVATGGSFDPDFESEATLMADDDLGLDKDEIDLTELEAAIDSVGTNLSEDTATIAEEDLELSLAPDMDTAEAPVEGDTELEINLDELNLEELEDTPGTEQAVAADDAPIGLDELDLDLDIDLEMASSASAPAPKATAPKDEEELDLSDLGDLMMESESAAPPAVASTGTTIKPEIINSGDIELEFQIEEDGPVAPVQEHLDTLTPETAPAIDETMTMPPPVEESEVKKKPKQKPKPVKKKSNKLLLVIFILVLLGAIGYGVYYAVTVLNIEIPYVSQYLKPAPKDPLGIMKLSTMEISSKFIENEQSGRLFVISGKVHSAYQEPRTKIRLQGKLFTKGKMLSQSENVYAGIILSDQELATLTRAEIKLRLSTPPSDIKIMPNQNLNFMVVFSDLPSTEELDEFALEPVKSVAAQ